MYNNRINEKQDGVAHIGNIGEEGELNKRCCKQVFETETRDNFTKSKEGVLKNKN